MPNRLAPELAQPLTTLFSAGTMSGLSDAALLERFLAGRDSGGATAELAFSTILERHGPLVLRVCRAIVPNRTDAEDVFQLTFLLLVQHAARIRNRAALGPWLHGVALRVARQHRRQHQTRARHLQILAQQAEAANPHAQPSASHSVEAAETAWLIHHTVDQMPRCYREAIILCDLQGLSHREAAFQLGCAEGTVKSRLARGRERLKQRLLARRPSLGFSALPGASLRPTRIPTELAQATLHQVLNVKPGIPLAASTSILNQEISRMMSFDWIRTIVGGALICSSVLGAAALTLPDQGGAGQVPIEKGEATEASSSPDAETAPQADSQRRTDARVYAVADLVPDSPRMRDDRGEPAPDFEPLVEFLTASVAPGSWKERDADGKPAATERSEQLGMIEPFLLNRSLIVRHEPAVQEQVVAWLTRLRRLKRTVSVEAAQPQPAAPQHPTEKALKPSPPKPNAPSAFDSIASLYARKTTVLVRMTYPPNTQVLHGSGIVIESDDAASLVLVPDKLLRSQPGDSKDVITFPRVEVDIPAPAVAGRTDLDSHGYRRVPAEIVARDPNHGLILLEIQPGMRLPRASLLPSESPPHGAWQPLRISGYVNEQNPTWSNGEIMTVSEFFHALSSRTSQYQLITAPTWPRYLLGTGIYAQDGMLIGLLTEVGDSGKVNGLGLMVRTAGILDVLNRWNKRKTHKRMLFPEISDLNDPEQRRMSGANSTFSQRNQDAAATTSFLLSNSHDPERQAAHEVPAPQPVSAQKPQIESNRKPLPEYRVDPPDLLRVEVNAKLPEGLISGDRLVRPDGTISLGPYGELQVAGLTTREIKGALVQHMLENGWLEKNALGLFRPAPAGGKPRELDPADSPEVTVEVAAYNSKVYHVVGQVASPGRFPVTGGETVLDALNYAGGLLQDTTQIDLELIRPRASNAQPLKLSIDLPAILGMGDSSTNYQILPGDRLVVSPRMTAHSARNARESMVHSTPPARIPAAEAGPTSQEARLRAIEEKLEELLKRLPRPDPNPDTPASETGAK